MTRATRLNPYITVADKQPASTTVKVIVKPTGGDYASPKLACDWIATQNPGPDKQFDVWIYSGVYTDIQWFVPAYTTLRGIGRLGTVWLKGEQPDSASDAQTTNNSTIQIQSSCSLINLMITARNMRYPVHSEAGGVNKDAVHTVQGCHIENYGNQGIVDYRIANSIAAGSPWPNWLPWGYGSASGVIENFTNTTLVGPTYGAFYIHNNQLFDKPTINTLDKCRIVNIDPTQSVIYTQSLGSGQVDRVNITNCEVSGSNYATETDTPWLPTDFPSQYANHSDIRLTYSGTPIGWNTQARGKALKITSASVSTTSTVRVSGTAANAVFSATPYYKDGGGGLQGYAYGDLDISGILVDINSSTTVNNTIGRRLGDCSSVNKTLTVTVDGGSPVDIVFSTNLTAVSNATIISTINTALGAAATAAEYLVSQGEVYPDFVDRQATMVNGSATVGIPRWSAVKRVNGKVQLMSTSDPATSFYGVALQQIPPGQYGRVLTKGLLLSSQLAGTPTVTDGVSIYHSDSTAGAFSTSGTRLFGVGSINGYCYFTSVDARYLGATGNAATATKWATARNIDGQALDGTANISVVAPGTHAATSKATPVDADEIPLVDSAASNVLAKLTWANLKSTIKSYYDSVVSTLTNKDLTSGTNTFPTFNQNTTGSAAKLTTARNINGIPFDGTAAITVWSRSIVSVTSSTTLGSAANTDYVALVGASGAPILPTAVGNTNRYTCKNVTTSAITVSTTSSQTIDGVTTVTIPPNNSLDFISDNSNWGII